MESKSVTLLDENTPWPEVWAKNPGTGFREPTPKPLIDIVMTGVDAWMHEKGEPPKDLIVSHKRRHEFLTMFNAAIGYASRDTAKFGATQFLGLRVLWGIDGGIRLA